ncbi:MAG: hypothetical protein JNG90_16660 [Planctomycetaceae bacterium]|nr:hypothetical protein [Planctomycetaceae bacterium]
MKRAIFAALLLATVITSSGCCAVKDLFCHLPVTRRLCGNGSIFCGPPIHSRACKSGCGETYWGECISDRVACCDPCDKCGNWCGPQTEYPGYVPPGAGGYTDYSAGPVMEGEGEIIYDGPPRGTPQQAPSQLRPMPPTTRRQGPARSAMQKFTVPEPIPDPRMGQLQRPNFVAGQQQTVPAAYRP